MGALTFGRGPCSPEMRSRRELTDAIAPSLSVVSDKPITTVQVSGELRVAIGFLQLRVT